MLIGLLLVGVACIALAAAFAWSLRGQRRQAALIAQQAGQLLELEQRLKELGKKTESYQQISVRMGEQLRELAKQVAPLPERLARMEQRDPSSLSYSQAARLVGMGASAAELSQSCGISRAEAELVSRMHQARVAG